jgi:hypothetical protein
VLVLATLLAGCVAPRAIRVDAMDFNDRLRRDRGPLTAEQREVAPDALRFGPWRAAGAEIMPLLRPDDPLAAALPQSDCWAMANSDTAGRDAMLAGWEVVGRVTPLDGSGKPVDDWIDPEDGVLDLGLCRLDDPVTRAVPVTRSGDRSAANALDCSAFTDIGIRPAAVSAAFAAGGNFPTCSSDAQVFAARLHAQRAAVRDAFGRCAAERAAIGGPLLRISHGVDFWREPFVHPADDPADARVSACQRDAPLIPPTTTRYTVDAGAFADAAPGGAPARVAEPAVQTFDVGARVARPLAAEGQSAAWRTRVVQHPTAGVRWEEGWSASLVVSELRVVRPLAGVPAQAQAAIAVRDVVPARATRLCIGDPDSPLVPAGLGCRFVCEDSDPADARLHFALDDRSCRDFQSRPATPQVTPTHALDSARAALSAGRSLRQPVRWSVDDPALAGAWLEFGLTLRGGTAAMRSGLSRADAGAVRVGESRRVTFAIDNVGAQALRVRQVDLLPSSLNAQDFRLELPFDPLPVPVGLAVDAGDAGVVAGPGGGLADPAALLRVAEGPSHLLATARRDARLVWGGVALQRSTDLLWRDVVAFPPGWVEALEPTSATALSMPSWRARPVPFVLRAREGFLLSVVASPRAVGERSARARVLADALPAGTPVEIVVELRARGLQGPLPQFLPQQLVLLAPGAEQRVARNVLLANDGDVAASLAPPVLTAPDGASLGSAGARLRVLTPDGAGGTLASGASRMARVEFLGTCTASGPLQTLEAELRWSTPDATAVLPIRATTRCAP